MPLCSGVALGEGSARWALAGVHRCPGSTPRASGPLRVFAVQTIRPQSPWPACPEDACGRVIAW